MESGYPVNAKHAELERRSAHQLRLKAVEMPRSSAQLVKSHEDDLSLEYLWNGENSLKAMEKNAECGGQPEILALVHVTERDQSLFTMKTYTKALYLENFLLIALALTFFIIQKNVRTKEN